MIVANVEVAALPSWNPNRFLTVAETMHGVSVGYDWFYHELKDEQRTAIEDGLYRAGLGEGLACWRLNCSWTPGIPDTGNCSRCWWIRANMNWNLVSNGGMAIAALALADVPRYAVAAEHALYATPCYQPATFVLHFLRVRLFCVQELTPT